MNSKHAVTFVAALSLAFCAPAVLSAQGSSSSKDANGSQDMSGTQMQSSVPASQMVATRAGLITTLDARDVHAGQKFEAKLPRKVHLKDGTELPGGTLLIGKIGTDDMNLHGRSKLVLCINEARLKDGKTVPVKATVVGIYPPGAQSSEYYMSNAAGDQVQNPWHNGITKIDELDALHDVDLHSNLNSRNSAVLVSNEDDNIKLKSGTELALAIAANNNQQSMNSSNGSGGGR